MNLPEGSESFLHTRSRVRFKNINQALYGLDRLTIENHRSGRHRQPVTYMYLSRTRFARSFSSSCSSDGNSSPTIVTCPSMSRAQLLFPPVSLRFPIRILLLADRGTPFYGRNQCVSIYLIGACSFHCWHCCRRHPSSHRQSWPQFPCTDR